MPAIAATYSDHSNDYYDRREKIDYDSYTGQDEVIHYDVDLNFDGVFDE